MLFHPPTADFKSSRGDEEAASKATSPLPDTTDPVALMRHMETREPLKLALLRDFPLVVKRLEKVSQGIKEMIHEGDGEEKLHKPLGWMHYRECTMPSFDK